MDIAAIEDRLIQVFDTPGFVGIALMVAVTVGALHAVAPGHGKSITAAYLLAGRARARDAVLLGTTVAVMHTVSVAVLALAWVAASATSRFATDVVTAWMQVAAAGAVFVVGMVLVTQRLTGRGGHHHHHGHDHHGHHHHGLGPEHHGHAHAERGPGSSRRMILALATAGGLLPSPSAFLVLVSGLLTGRALYAVVLVLAFALGMAATLSAVGLATIRGRDLLAQRSVGSSVLAAVHRHLPVAGAFGVLVGGGVYLAAALRFVR